MRIWRKKVGIRSRSSYLREAHPKHRLRAFELFFYLAKKGIGALTAVLGGLDTLVFTGGIGEHAVAIRWEISDGLAHLGIKLDVERNAAGAAIISAEDAGVVVRVIATNETLMVARHTWAVLFPSSDNEAADLAGRAVATAPFGTSIDPTAHVAQRRGRVVGFEDT